MTNVKENKVIVSAKDFDVFNKMMNLFIDLVNDKSIDIDVRQKYADNLSEILKMDKIELKTKDGKVIDFAETT